MTAHFSSQLKMYVPTLCHLILRSDGASLESDHQQPVRGVDISGDLKGFQPWASLEGPASRQKITRARTCVGMSLAVSRKEGHPERSFPEISAYSGVMGPKVRYFYDSWYIYIWIVSRMNVIKILCPIVDSSYPWRVGFRGWQDEKRNLKISIFWVI